MILKLNSKFIFLYAFALFIIAAVYGFLIRWNFTFPVGSFPYKNILQSHSHVAFLGWGYLAVIGVILKLFTSVKLQKHQLYKFCFLIIYTTATGMLISFPIGGYKVFSIVLLSVFGIATYVVSFKILKDIKEQSVATKLVKFGIYYYLLSSLATWFIAVVMVTQGKTDLYYNTIYFYLHFLYNGFFVFALFGILFKLIENEGIQISKKTQNAFFVYLNSACIPAYALSILWSDVHVIFYVIGFAASILQLISLLYLLNILKLIFKNNRWNFILRILLKFSVIAYALKIIIQVFSSFPYFVEKSLALKPYFIIGYLHLFTLAFMSALLFFILNQLKIFNFYKFSKVGIYVFLCTVFCTELLFFIQGFLLLLKLNPLPHYNLWVLFFSGLLVMSLVVIFIQQFKRSKLEN
ncbi:hypothetical protein ACFQZW_09575 [Lutibacter aestuarii]|uniref:Uncharacterized protein n=1 Tax=Lutibacter aestuarii TaxID=861111 RepID=A0ABW2ZBK0_9FLAO